MTELQTERLVLRQWRTADRDLFAKLNADSRVMQYFPAPLSREESDALADRIEADLEQHNWGLWAVEIRHLASFAGVIGLDTPRFESHFTPCTEIAWRLLPEFWGHGYATEGAMAALGFAFHELNLDELVSFTTVTNLPSRRVMERIGMVRDPEEDFPHPLLPTDHALSTHVLYRKLRSAHPGTGKTLE